MNTEIGILLNCSKHLQTLLKLLFLPCPSKLEFPLILYKIQDLVFQIVCICHHLFQYTNLKFL